MCCAAAVASTTVIGAGLAPQDAAPASPAPSTAAGLEGEAPDANTPEDSPSDTPPAEAEGAEDGENAAPSPTSANAYQAISIRNSFGLREPPPPPAPPPAEAPPPVNTGALKLTGITSLLGKRAMFAFNDGRTNQVSALVREGERDPFIQDLEVLEIDPLTRTVRVRFGGKEMQMDFAKDGLMPPTNQVAIAGAPGLPRPGTQVAMANLPQRPSSMVGQPTAQAINATATGAPRSFPVRPTRLGAGLSPGVLGRPVTTTGGGIGTSMPAGGEGLPVLSPDQQTQLIREQVNFGRQIDLQLPPVPPVPGLEDLSQPPAPPVLPGEIPQFPFPQLPQ